MELPWVRMIDPSGGFTPEAKDLMLDALNLDLMALHSDRPGMHGRLHRVSGFQPSIFCSSLDGCRPLRFHVDFTDMAPLQMIGWFSVWDRNGGRPVFLACGQLEGVAGDVGNFRVLPVLTRVALT